MSIFKDKVLLITEGSGSFGNAILKRFLDTDIKEIIIFSENEKKQENMHFKYKNDKIVFYIGDVKDYRAVKDAMDGVDYFRIPDDNCILNNQKYVDQGNAYLEKMENMMYLSMTKILNVKT